MAIINFFEISINIEKYIILLTVNIIIISLLSYFTNNAFNKFGLLDIPNKRKTHKEPVPISGGTILILSTLFLYYFLENFTKINLSFYLNIIFLSLIFFILGLIDDIKNLKTTIKIFIILTFLTLTLLKYDDFIVSELRFNYILNLNIPLGYFAIPFTVFCIFMFFNALNYSDGKNGICITYSIFILIVITTINENIRIFEHFLIISLIILLLFNLRNKLFLGNSGVNFLSVFLSLLIIKTYNMDKNNLFCDEIFLLMLLPGLDAARVTILRAYKKISPLAPDNRHFHHYLSKFINDNLIWIIYIFISSTPIILLNISSNFLLSVSIPVIIYFYLIIRSSKY